MRAENGEYGSDPYSESDSELGYSDSGAEQEAVAEPGRQKPDLTSRLVDWLTLPGQVVGCGYNGHDIGSDGQIKASTVQSMQLRTDYRAEPNPFDLQHCVKESSIVTSPHTYLCLKVWVQPMQ